MAERHPKSRAFLGNGPDRANVAKIQARINALRIHIERYSNYIHAACTLAVAKECPFYAIRTAQQAQLCAGGAGCAIIVRAQADERCLAIAQGPAEPFDLGSITIWCRDFDSDRQVHEGRVLQRR